MKNRSRTEIIATILKCARPGATITRIMFVGFFSYSQLTGYLKLLQETGMMSCGGPGQVYRTTGKGLKFLEMASEMDTMLSTKAQEAIPLLQDKVV